ncbi:MULTISPECIES: hypothetical protein [unclassified Cupriavidus]|uniref:hypothetical protein n=1 Tax=unclassified Cupriavidus TaxID=2640874 RepID=UPI00313B31A3
MVAISFAGGQPEDVEYKDLDTSTAPGQKRPVAQAAAQATGTEKQGWTGGYSILDKSGSFVGQVVDWIKRFMKAVLAYIQRLFSGSSEGVGSGEAATATVAGVAPESSDHQGAVGADPVTAKFMGRGNPTPVYAEATAASGSAAAAQAVGVGAAQQHGFPADALRRAAEEIAHRWPALGAEVLKDPEILKQAQAMMGKDGGPDKVAELVMRLAMERDHEAQAQALIGQLEQKLKEAGIADHNNGLGLNRRDLARMMIFGMEEPGTRQALMPEAKQIVEAFLKEPQLVQQLAANLAMRAAKMGIQEIAANAGKPAGEAPAKPKGLTFGPPTQRPAGGHAVDPDDIQDPDDAYLAKRDRPAQ